MITFISLVYASFYFLVFGKGLVKKNARNISIFVGVGVVLVGAIVFVWLTVAPTSSNGRVFQFVIQIVPKVSGDRNKLRDLAVQIRIAKSEFRNKSKI